MPRETDRRKSQRADAPLREGRDDVRLQEQRRFFSARGNDQAVRNARAIENAFGVGVDFVGGQIDRANTAGHERALEEMGAGGSRNVDEKNAAYHRAWDALDDQRSLQQAQKELPEILRGMDAENLHEEFVQTAINQYMKEQFEGLDLEDGDHTALAGGLVELEAQLIGEHRDTQIAKLQESQRVDTYDAFKDEFELTGEVNYELLGERTNHFFDGAEKRTTYWQLVYDLAIEQGDPSIIDNVPERFASGDPTGITDPKLLQQHNAARASARGVAAAKAKAEAKAYEADLNANALNAIVGVINGHPMSAEMVNNYAALPGADATKTAALFKSLHSIQGSVEDMAFDPAIVQDLSQRSFAGEDISRAADEAYLAGDLGEGRKGVDQYQELARLGEEHSRVFNGVRDEEFKYLAKDIDARYPIQRNAMGLVVNPTMAEINRQAQLEFRQAKIADGDSFDPDKRWQEITERFDARRDRLAPPSQGIERPKNVVVLDYIDNKATSAELQQTGVTVDEIMNLQIDGESKKRLLEGLRQNY